MTATLTTTTTYRADHLLVRPGDGDDGGGGMVIKIRAADLDGFFGLMEGRIEPGELLAPHTHAHEAQAVYVIEGQLEFEVGGEGGLRFAAEAGSYVIKPKGVQHCFWNQTDTPVRYIELSSHDNFEGFIDSADQPDKVKMLVDADRRYGMTWHVERIPVLLQRHGLRGVSGVELPRGVDLAAQLHDLERSLEAAQSH